MDAITVEQLRVFVTIAEQGSFAAAARHLNRTQSAVTYTVQKLEGQTGVPLFDRDQYRPSLTEAGRSLLPHARKVIGDIADYRLHADRLRQGLEADLRIVVSQFVSPDLYVDVLKRFELTFPSVRLDLATITVQSTAALDQGQADLSLMPEFFPMGNSYVRRHCGVSKIIVVAAAVHPLVQVAVPLTNDIMSRHMQIMLVSREASSLKQNHAQHADNCWRVDDLETKRRLILGGVGWGSMPDHLVAGALRDGTMAVLEPAEWDGSDRLPQLPIVAAHRRDRPPGPAGQWLFEEFSRGGEPIE
ncbi:LysR family transcriptional regulator [Azospirillum sp. B510]|uniref:LysR family transcriptional regulator n=1 Tax=Azospirillum sp. (strain B510) TaxID=137722 RepID=UPI0011D0709B|nr:LysR family transcriptional regulator [Azospirillum sp. B510]